MKKITAKTEHCPVMTEKIKNKNKFLGIGSPFAFPVVSPSRGSSWLRLSYFVAILIYSNIITGIQGRN